MTFGPANLEKCSVPEAVHHYNVTPKDENDAATAPMNGVFRHPGGDRNVGPPENSEAASEPLPTPRPPGVFHIGDPVWVPKRRDRCISKSAEGPVTEVVSSQTVEVDGVPRHVRNLRLRCKSPADPMPPSSPPIASISGDAVTRLVPPRAVRIFDGSGVHLEGR